MPYYYDDDSDYDSGRGRRRPSANRHNSDRRSFYLGADLGGGRLHRARSQGHSPAPVVNVFNDVSADAYQRTESSRSPPYPQSMPYPPYPAQSPRGRRDRLGSDLVSQFEELAMENQRLRSRSRGRSDAGHTGSSEYYQWELRQKEKELTEIQKQKQWETEKKRYEQDYEMKMIAEKKERERIIADYERKQREESEDRKAEEKRIKEKLEREKWEKEEAEKREWEEFERRQREKKAEEEEKKKKKEAEFEEEMRKRLARQGFTPSQIDAMVKEEEKKTTKEITTIKETKKWTSKAPVYAKVHRDHLSIETLRYYEVPYEYDRADPNFIIILREMDKYETEVLFEHTRRLRAGKLLLEAPGKDRKQWAFYRKRDRSTSRVKKAGVVELRT